jgi:hypothetical protein
MSLRDRIDAALAAGAARTGNPVPVRRSVRPKSPTGTSDPDRSLPCVYFTGKVVGTGRCPPCGQKTTLKVFRCNGGYETCTPVTPSPDARGCCKKCPDHRRFPSVTRRHLLYHVYPRFGSRWRERLSAVARASAAFDGLKLVAIATDHTTDPVSEVERVLAGTGCEVEAFVNRPDRREVASFGWLFGRASEFVTPGDVTVWGHAKGSTRPLNTTCHRWAGVLETVFFDHLPAVERVLGSYPVAGCFKKVGRGWAAYESKSEWHYSGSWWAFRNRPLFSKEGWDRADRFWCGAETYPSLHFPNHEAGCVFHTAPVPVMNLYNGRYWHGVVEPAFRQWLVENAGRRTPHTTAVARSSS